MGDLWYDPFFDYDGDGVMDDDELADMDLAMECEERMMEYEAEMEAAEFHLRRAHEILYGSPPVPSHRPAKINWGRMWRGIKLIPKMIGYTLVVLWAGLWIIIWILGVGGVSAYLWARLVGPLL